MFTHADDRAQGVPIETGTYPDGEDGIQKSLRTICKKIREGAQTAVMKSFAGNVLRQAGFPQGVRDQAAAMLAHVRKTVGYAPDTLGSEQIQSAVITLCVEGAPICIPIADCDDLVTALGTMLAAAGMDVEVVRQIFGAGDQQHVLVEVRTEDGDWYPLDPSSRAMPAGMKATASTETRCSPWDANVSAMNDQAQFVGIGALPVYMYEKKGWRQMQAFEGLGSGDKEGWYPVAPNVEARLPMNKVVLWNGGWWYRAEDGTTYQWSCCADCAEHATDAPKGVGGCGCKDKMGTGALVDDVTSLLASAANPINVAKQMWGQIQGRSWTQAVSAANARAAAKKWISGDKASTDDLMTLVVSTTFNAKQISDAGYPEVAADLNRTWAVLAQRLHLSATPSDVNRMKTTANAEVAPLIIIVAALTGVAVVVAILYFATKVIDNALSKIECERELMRIHAEYNRIVERQIQGQQLSEDDRAVRDQLLKAQQAVAAGCTQKSPDFDPWPYVIGAGIIGAVVLGVVYREEIKEALVQKPKRLRA